MCPEGQHRRCSGRAHSPRGTLQRPLFTNPLPSTGLLSVLYFEVRVAANSAYMFKYLIWRSVGGFLYAEMVATGRRRGGRCSEDCQLHML